MNKVGINTLSNSFQHSGIGKQLVGYAIRIARDHGYNKLSVISGVGVRNYYKHLGFLHLDTPSQCLIMNIMDIPPRQYYALFSKHINNNIDIQTENQVLNQTAELVYHIPELNSIGYPSGYNRSSLYCILGIIAIIIIIIVFVLNIYKND